MVSAVTCNQEESISQFLYCTTSHSTVFDSTVSLEMQSAVCNGRQPRWLLRLQPAFHSLLSSLTQLFVVPAKPIDCWALFLTGLWFMF
ncbi:unnamed protein product, partial [Musa banksii]